MTIVYPYRGALYINLTNRCPCACVYCIKNKWRWKFRGRDLKLEREPSSGDVLREIKKFDEESGPPPRETVFCGYGEPFMRFDVMKAVAGELKKNGRRVRVNTTGLGNAVHGRDLLPEFVGLLDEIVVSLNAANPVDYARVNRPAQDAEKAFAAAVDFARRGARLGFDVTLTAVELPGLDVAAVKKIADGLGVKFRARPYLDDYEDR